MGYLNNEESKDMLKRFMENSPLEELEPVCTKEDILEARKLCKKIFVSDDVLEYIVNIQRKTLNNNNIALGVSPRGTLAMLKALQVYAAIKGRKYATPDDVKKLAPYVLSHRIIIKNNLRIKGVSNKEIIKEVLGNVKVPTENWGKEVM